jgi:hypothetical protein
MLNEGHPFPARQQDASSSLFIIGYINQNTGFWRSSLFLYVTQRWLVVSCRRCGTAYRSRLQESSSPRRSRRRCILLWYDASSEQKIHLRMYLFQSNCTFLRKNAYYDFSGAFRLIIIIIITIIAILRETVNTRDHLMLNTSNALCYVYVFLLLCMFCSVYSVFIVLFYVLFVCKSVLYYCHQVSTQ